MTARVGVGVLALLFVAVPGSAQTVRGTVRDSVSQAPILGAVVMTMSADGRAFARTVTDERGAYVLPRAAEASRLRALRLGFRPRDLAIPDATDQSVTLDFRMALIPRLLERIVAVANPSCPRRSDADLVFGLWEQAKAGLLATVVAREARPAQAKVAVVQRLRAGSRDTIADQRVRLDSGTMKNSFRASQPPADYIRWGFVLQDLEGQNTWFGPDAEVLLSEAFQRAYCFSLASRDRNRPTQLGLRFSAARSAGTRVDIDGTLWIDSAARVIREIEFRYVGLQIGAERYRPGGYVRFASLPNGVALVNDWSLRMVSRAIDTTADVRRPRASTGGAPGSWGEAHPVERDRPFVVTEKGGELLRGVWPDGATYQASLGAIRIRATLSDGRPAVGARVQLDSTDYAGTTDSTGQVELRDLLPGPYRAIVHDSTLAIAGLHMRTPVWFTAARESTLERAFVLGTAAELLAQSCGDGRYTGAYHVFVARVTTSRGVPLAGVNWSIGPAQQPDVRTLGGTFKGVTNATGIIEPCGRFEPGSEIELRLWSARSQYTELAPKLVRTRLTQRANAISVEMPR